nr:MAG TPA: hypothetical protein [Bacteriophage sp.]
MIIKNFFIFFQIPNYSPELFSLTRSHIEKYVLF